MLSPLNTMYSCTNVGNQQASMMVQTVYPNGMVQTVYPVIGQLQPNQFVAQVVPHAPFPPQEFFEYLAMQNNLPMTTFVPPVQQPCPFFLQPQYSYPLPFPMMDPSFSSPNSLGSPNMTPQFAYLQDAFNDTGYCQIQMPETNEVQASVPECIDPLTREETMQQLDACLSDDQRNMAFSDFISQTSNVMQKAELRSRQQGRRWYKRESNAVDIFRKYVESDFDYWAKNGDLDLLNLWIEIGHEMAKLIDFEATKNKRKMKELANKFRRTLKYLKQDNFDSHGAVDFENLEKARSLKIFIRLFKVLQMMRFDHFSLSESKPQDNNSAKKSLRGDCVIRNRCKRMQSFRPEAHAFDAFVYNLIISGQVDVDNMYVCRDHKAQDKKQKGKTRQVAGLLFYFVCPTPEEAEKLLRLFVRFSEGENDEQTKILQNMFRKLESTKAQDEEDARKRQRLCSDEPWSPQEFQHQKEMYHFTLAMPGEDKKNDKAEPNEKGTSTKPPSVRLETPTKSSSRTSSLEYPYFPCAGF